jgi:sugar lactone lactonase YvrE
VRRRLTLAAALLALAATALTGLADAGAAQRSRFDTDLLARIPTPGFPALAYVHPDGRIYEGTYVNPNATGLPSRIFEFTGEGTLLRSFTVPGQDLAGEHGVQVTTSDAQGNLVILDRTPARALKLDRRTGEFSTYATFADLKPCPPGEAATTCSPTLEDRPAIPNYGAWGPDGSLYVTDFGQGVVWRVPAGGGQAVVWLSDRRLDGGDFGTTGILLGPDGKSLYVAQGSSAGLGSLNPTTGKLYSVAIEAGNRPGPLRQMWETQPGDVPDGFAIAASGRIYVPLVGLPAQIAVLAPEGREIERFPQTPGSGDNGSEVPFDSPSSVRFLGTRLIVANQSALAGDATHQALLDVEAGETGLPEVIPGKDQIAPTLSRVAVSPRRFAVVRRGGKVRRARRGHTARGARLRFSVSEPVTVQIRVERREGGRYPRRQTIERTVAAGRRSIVFTGRVRRRGRSVALPRSVYRFSVRVSDPSGNRSARVFRSFRIVRGR